MSSIEERVAKLEQEVFGKRPSAKNWRTTVGKFSDDPFMDDVIDGALKSREEERQQLKDSDDRESR